MDLLKLFIFLYEELTDKKAIKPVQKLPDKGIRKNDKSTSVKRYEFEVGGEVVNSVAEKIKWRTTQTGQSIVINYKKLQHEISRKYSFYDAGKTLAKYEDKSNLERYAPFFMYYSQYNSMSEQQLRSYLVWRTKVRSGVVEVIDTSYLFVYIYEILHLIGFKDGGDAFAKLVFIWEKSREFEPKIDNYLKSWAPDFIQYHELSAKDVQHAFYIKMLENGMICTPKSDANILLDAIRDKNVAVVNDIITKHGYNFKRGAFSKKDKTGILERIVNHLTLEMLDKQNTVMQNLTFMSREYNHLFNGAVFELPQKKYDDATLTPTLNKDFIVEYSREIEMKLDAQFSVTQRLKKGTRRYLKRPELNFIRDTIKAFVLEHSLTIKVPKKNEKPKKGANVDEPVVRKEIVIDIGSLQNIRDNADRIAERLVPIDDEYDGESIETTPVVEPVIVEDFDNVWLEFFHSLSQDSISILTLISMNKKYSEVANYAMSNFLMIEEEIEKINESAILTIGDNLLESDMNSIAIYEDYRADVLELLQKKIGKEIN